MDSGTTYDQRSTPTKNVTSSERFKYSLDNPVTLKSLSNIRNILDQHTNFLMGLAATSSISSKNDLTTALNTIPSLFVLQRLCTPLKIQPALPEPIPKWRPVTPEIKTDSTQKSNIDVKEGSTDFKKQEVFSTDDTSQATTTTAKSSHKWNDEPTKDDVIKCHDTSTTSLIKPSRKAVAFYAEVDQEVEEIRKRLLSTSPQPLINGIPNEANICGEYKFWPIIYPIA